MYYTEPEFSVVAIKAPIGKTASAFVELRKAKWTCDVPRQPAAGRPRLNRSLITAIKVKRNPWTLIYRSLFRLGKHDYKLAVDFKSLSTLLMGEHIYGDRRLGLRELIQNGIDSCRVRAEIETARRQYGDPVFEPRVQVIIDRKDGQGPSELAFSRVSCCRIRYWFEPATMQVRCDVTSVSRRAASTSASLGTKTVNSTALRSFFHIANLWLYSRIRSNT